MLGVAVRTTDWGWGEMLGGVTQFALPLRVEAATAADTDNSRNANFGEGAVPTLRSPSPKNAFAFFDPPSRGGWIHGVTVTLVITTGKAGAASGNGPLPPLRTLAAMRSTVSMPSVTVAKTA